MAFAEYRFLQTKSEDKYEGEIASLEDQDFVTSIHGMHESTRARIERIRDDKFKEGSSSL